MATVPSLSEIENVAIDAQRGSGEPATIIDNSKLLDILNQNAIVAANNDWNRYNRFLTDYETRIKSAQDIMDKEVADSDREYLKKRTVDILKTALDDPYKIYSPEFNNGLAQVRADATSSKMARDFAEKNLSFLATNPTLNTEENKAKVLDYLDRQTVEKGGRKTFTLDMPNMFNRRAYFAEFRKDPTVMELINANRVDEPNQRYYKRQDTKYKRDPYLQLVASGYDATPEIQKMAKAEFEALDPSLKSQFKDPKDYWVQLGGKYFGSDKDVIEQGTWLEGFVSNTINDAIKNGKTTYTVGANGDRQEQHELQLSNPTLSLFAFEETNKEGKKRSKTPDRAVVSKDGQTIEFKFYKTDDDGEYIKQNGNIVIDEKKTKKVSRDEFKARLGKDLLTPKQSTEELQSTGATPSWAFRP
ncbi:MAG: hypothetical protein RLY43_1998 [Bacteroidota bacterium]